MREFGDDRRSDAADAGPTDGSVPGCGTGPAGRARFVLAELADLWREFRHRTAHRSDGNEEHK